MVLAGRDSATLDHFFGLSCFGLPPRLPVSGSSFSGCSHAHKLVPSSGRGGSAWGTSGRPSTGWAVPPLSLVILRKKPPLSGEASSAFASSAFASPFFFLNDALRFWTASGIGTGFSDSMVFPSESKVE